MIAKILYYRYTCCNATLLPLIRNALQTTNGSKPGSKWISFRWPTKKDTNTDKDKDKTDKTQRQREKQHRQRHSGQERQTNLQNYIYIT